jgi:hypothetical protein
MRNKPLKGLMKKSPMKVDKKGAAKTTAKTTAKTAVETGKAFVRGAAKRVLGVVGAFIDPATTSRTDQPGTGGHGGKKVKSLI